MYALANIDMTAGFCLPGHPLYVPGAERLGTAFDAFLARLKTSSIRNHVKAALVTNDTHFAGEYPHSAEARMFPFHQGWGTAERDYTFDMRALAKYLPTFQMWKNKFDMWDVPDSGVPVEKIVFESLDERADYAKLFMAQHYDPGRIEGHPMMRQMFMEFMKHLEVGTFLVSGVATDYCVYCAMAGMLWHGFDVILLTDLTQGIFSPAIPGGRGVFDPPEGYAGVANVDELVAQRPMLAQAYLNGRFRAMTTAEFLANTV